MNQTSLKYRNQLEIFEYLAAKIPEIALEAATPTYTDHVRSTERKESKELISNWNKTKQAHQPYIKQQLREQLLEFEHQNKHLMSVEEMESAKQGLIEEYNNRALSDDQLQQDL